MMENGELLAADVLPKVAKEMKKVAAVGLEDKLDSLRVAQGQFFNQLEKTGNFIFEGSFSDGLKDLFQSLTEGLKDSEAGLEGLSEVFKAVFNLIRNGAEILIPVLNTLFTVLGKAAEVFNAVFDSDLGKILLGMAGLAMAIKKIITLTKAWEAATKSAMIANLLAAIPPKVLIGAAVVAGGAALTEDVAKGIAGNKNSASYQIANNPMVAGASGVMGGMASGFTSLFRDKQEKPVNVEVSIDGVKQAMNDVSENAVNKAWQSSYNSGGN